MDPSEIEARTERDPVLRIGRERELDEIVARAQSFPGAHTVETDGLVDVPIVDIGRSGRAPIIAAGPRVARTAAAMLGEPATTRHNWIPIGPRNVAGRVRGIACADPGGSPPLIWYAASAGGGVWKTTNGGRRWEPLWHAEQACLEVGAIAVAPNDPRRIYAATGEAVPASGIAVRGFGIFVSTDAGGSWDNHGAGTANPQHRRGFEAIAVDPVDHEHCWAVGLDGAFRTIDGGVHWTQLQPETHFTDVKFAGARLLLARGRSTNGEAAVIRLATPRTALDADLVAAANASRVIAPRAANRAWPAAGKIAIAGDNATAYTRWVAEDDRHIGIFRSTNINAATASAITWTRLRDHPQFREEGQGTYNLCIAVDPNRPNLVATGMTYVHVSDNATAGAQAVRWRRVMSWELQDEGLRGHHADQHQLVIAGSPSELWVADDGGVARSTDWATAKTIDHGQRFKPDPLRPLPAGSVTWRRRDLGISGAQPYDLGQSPLVASAVAVGLQDNGTYMRTGGLTWRPIFGADGGFAVFDPDDPYRLLISFYAGLVVLQFPALLDRLFKDGARDDDNLSFRLLTEGLLIGDDTRSAPFVPELTRHPRRSGRALLARSGRLYGLQPQNGERFNVEPVGRSFMLRFIALTPLAPTVLIINDTPGAVAFGLVAGTYSHDDPSPTVTIPGTFTSLRRTSLTLHSRLPAPYVMAEGSQLTGTLNGTAFSVTFNAAAGVTVSAVTVNDVLRLLRGVLPAAQAEIQPHIWETPSAVHLITRSTGPGSKITLDGNAFDPVATDGLSRLGLNRGTYLGDVGRPASVLIGYQGDSDEDRRVNRDFSPSGSRQIAISVDGVAAAPISLVDTDFPDVANITAGQLAAVLRANLPASVDVVATPAFPLLVLRSRFGSRVVLSGTAAARLGVSGRGARAIGLGMATLTSRHAGQHRRNRGSVDLTPAVPGTALQLVISDGTHATGPLGFTEGVGGNVAALRSVTVEELHRVISAHLVAHPAVQARTEPKVYLVPGAASELRFSPADDLVMFAGFPDGGVFVSQNDGGTWTDVTDPKMRQGDRPVEAIALHPSDRNIAYVASSGESTVAADPGFVFKTIDLGRSWQPVGHTVVGGVATGIVTAGRPIGVNALEVDPDTPNELYAATDAGVFRSTDAAATWQPFAEGLPNAPVVDLALEPTERVLRAALWTRGVYERHIDNAPPEDARLVIRATELDDGKRPTRSAPSYATSAPEPIHLGSPDIKVVRTRPDIGSDADIDGVTFDLDVAHDDVIPGTAAEVMVQVANFGGLTLDAPAPPAGVPPTRVVVLFAPVDAGPPPLPPEFWMRLTAGPLPLTLGAWTVIGDGGVPRPIRSGDTAIRSFPVNWSAPALASVTTLGILAVATSWNDPIVGGPTDIARLLAVERRVAYREVPVRLAVDDRTLLLRSTNGRAITVEQATPPLGTGVADRLGFTLPVIAGSVLQATPAAAATYGLSVVSPPGPAIVIRSSAPITADLAILAVGDEVDNLAAATSRELARVINRLASASGLPIEAYEIPVGIGVLCRADIRVRAGGPAQVPLGLAGAFSTFLPSDLRTGWFNLTGAASLTLTVQIPGQPNVAVNVDLAPENFEVATAADPATIVRNIEDSLADAELGDFVHVFTLDGLAIRGRGHATLAVGGPVAGVLSLAVDAEGVAVSAMDTADISTGPVLHIEVTPRVVVRFDGDPSEIADLAHASPADVRRTINLACELASVPVKAEVPQVQLRVAASPADTAARHIVTGGAQLAELVASATPIAAGNRAALFEERTALGVDAVETGVNGFLYLRLRNTGNADCPATRMRLIRIDLTTTPLGRQDIATATVPLPVAAGSSHIEEFRWDPGGAAPRTDTVLVVVDDDRADRRIDLPAQFASHEDLFAFVAARPSVALRTFAVRDP